TFAYLKGRKHAPENWDEAVQEWRNLASDKDAIYDKVITIDGNDIAPMVSWGTNPSMTAKVDEKIPTADSYQEETDRRALHSALQYMGLKEGMAITDIAIQHVFIGSCTNSRIEDLRQAASVIKGQKVFPGVRALVVPGSQQVKKQADADGLDNLFVEAGFEWRDAGCSMC
ncbi:aconitase family protein, partial [Streptococcus hyovaginalis]